MNFLFPILGAVLQAGSATLDKVILSVQQVHYKTYTAYSFPLIFFITFIIFLIFRPPLSFDLFTGNLLWLLIVLIGISITTNFIFYRALDNDRLGEIQTIDLLRNIPIIILSGILFVDERNVIVIILALTAVAAVIWSHWGHHHFKMARRTLPFLIWVLSGAALSAPVSKILLTSWNPISLGLVQTGVMALVFVVLFSNHAGKISFKAFLLLLVTNILTTIAWILFYVSYQRIGVIYTTLIFSIQPLLVYVASVFFLKEPVHRKKVIAFAIVLFSIGITQMIG